MKENVSLQNLNTFGIEANARYFYSLNNLEELNTLSSLPLFFQNRIILGGGSNILFTKNFDGIVIHNQLKGVELLSENGNEVLLKVYAGEIWHDLVLYTIDRNWYGLENLSLIPGRVGASPMQNIGAYGVELQDVFYSLEAWNIEKQQMEVFDKNACHFGYRESIFKNQLKNKYIIISVSFVLKKEAKLNVSYGDIEKTLQNMGVQTPSLQTVSQAVIAIRSAKLPNPKEIGNAGSFFKNPVLANQKVQELKLVYENMPSYPVDELSSKVPAGWLIEQAGWKGKSFGTYGVHKNQALVLVNYGGAKGEQIKELAFKIQEDIQNKFGISISPEVNFI
jgi:UDP-N-acetylmuramate dehydrogenase